MDPTYYYSSPLSPTRWGPLIRAPLSSEYNNSSSSSELDPLSNSDEDADVDAGLDGGLDGSGSVGVRPVARLTNDDDVEDADELFDEVDGDGYTVARVSSHLDRNPGSDEESEGVEEDSMREEEEIDRGFDGLERNYEKDGILEEFEDDVDGVVEGETVSKAVAIERDDVEEEEEEEEEDGDDDLKLEEENIGKGFDEKDPNLGKNSSVDNGSSVVGEIGNENGDLNALHGLDENSESSQEKDGVLGENLNEGRKNSSSDVVEEEKGGGDEDVKAEEETNDRDLSENYNLGENYNAGVGFVDNDDATENEAVELVSGLDDNGSSAVGGIGKEDGHLDSAVHEIDENLGSGSDPMNPKTMEVKKFDSVDIDNDEAEEDSEHKEVIPSNAIADSTQNDCPILKGDPDVAKGLTIKSDGENGSEATDRSNVTILYPDDSKTDGTFAEPDALVNELVSESSDSIIIEEEKLPVGILEDSKTMGIKGLVKGSPIVVQSGSHSTKDEVVESNSFKTGDYADLVADEIGKENRNLDCVYETNSWLEPREVKKSNFVDLEKDVEEDSEYREVESAAIKVAEVGNAIDDSEEDYGLVVKGNSDSIYKEVESGAIEAEKVGNATDDSNQNHRLVGKGDPDVIEVPPLEVDNKNAGKATESFNEDSLDVDKKEETEIAETESLLELLVEATSSSNNTPAGLRTLSSPFRPTRRTIFTSPNLAVASKPDKPMTEEEKKLHEKVESIRVMFLRLVHRLGYSYKDFMPISVLYQLALVEDIKYWAFRVMHARNKAFELEREEKDKIEFSCTILLIGKVGVGKSAIINSIFDKEKTITNPFRRETTSVRKIEGVLDGVKIQIVDTPGLSPYILDQPSNMKILRSIRKHMKRCPPYIVVYIDRLDTQALDYNDLPVLRSITSILGSSVWSNALIALTHASKAPPEGPNSLPLSYEAYVNQRACVVQKSIQQAVGDMRLMNPIILVENHPSCRRNREGQRVLPNGSIWISHLLLMCYSLKILVEASSPSKVQDSFLKKLLGFHFQSPPMNFFWSSLLESKVHPNIDSGIELDAFSDEEDEEEDEYDQLPPFHPLTKSQIANLTKEHKRTYVDEYDYRMKLLEKKQWKEEIRILKEIKRDGKKGEYFDDDTPTMVYTPLPEIALPPSFDLDDRAYRYRNRILEQRSQLLTRPILDPHGWDHDYGYDTVSLENNFAVARKFPAAIYVKLRKDKEDFNIQMDSSVSAKHGESGSTLASFDVQTIGSHQAYILRGETKFKNLKNKNKTALGVSLTCLGDTVATGLKLEDQISIGKRVNLLVNTGAVRAEGNVVYGALFEATLREKDNPIGQALATLGLSVVKNCGNLVICGTLQSQVSVGRNSNISVRVGMNDKSSGLTAVRATTSDQLHTVLVGLIPILYTIFRNICSSPGMRFGS